MAERRRYSIDEFLALRKRAPPLSNEVKLHLGQAYRSYVRRPRGEREPREPREREVREKSAAPPPPPDIDLPELVPVHESWLRPCPMMGDLSGALEPAKSSTSPPGLAQGVPQASQGPSTPPPGFGPLPPAASPPLLVPVPRFRIAKGPDTDPSRNFAARKQFAKMHPKQQLQHSPPAPQSNNVHKPKPIAPAPEIDRLFAHLTSASATTSSNDAKTSIQATSPAELPSPVPVPVAAPVASSVAPPAAASAHSHSEGDLLAQWFNDLSVNNASNQHQRLPNNHVQQLLAQHQPPSAASAPASGAAAGPPNAMEALFQAQPAPTPPQAQAQAPPQRRPALDNSVLSFFDSVKARASAANVKPRTQAPQAPPQVQAQVQAQAQRRQPMQMPPMTVMQQAPPMHMRQRAAPPPHMHAAPAPNADIPCDNVRHLFQLFANADPQQARSQAHQMPQQASRQVPQQAPHQVPQHVPQQARRQVPHQGVYAHAQAQAHAQHPHYPYAALKPRPPVPAPVPVVAAVASAAPAHNDPAVDLHAWVRRMQQQQH